MAAKLGTLTLDLVAKTGSYTQPLSKAEQMTKRTSRQISADMSKASSSVDLLGASASRTSRLLGSLVATAGIGFSASELIKYSDTYTGLNNRLKLVTTSETQLANAVKDTFEISQLSRSSWETTATIYQRFAQNSDRLGLSQEKVASITETVSKAVAISGASTESANAAMMQFGQALASGVLRGEEFNSVNEQTPAVLDAIAKGLGVARADLKKMAGDGELTAEVLIKALQKAEKSVDDLFGKTDITIGQSFTYLSNEITKFVGEAGSASGSATVLAESIQFIGSKLELMAGSLMIAAAGYAGSYIPAITSSITAGYAKITQLVQQIAIENIAAQTEKQMASQQIAGAQASLTQLQAEKLLEAQRLKAQITSQGRMASITRMAELKKIEAQVTRELAVAETTLASVQSRTAISSGALLGILGGPVGMGLTVAAVAAGYLLMRDNGEKANDMLSSQGRYANMATEGLDNLSGAQKQAAVQELSEQLMIQSGQLQGAKNSFEELTLSIHKSNKSSSEAYRIWAELKSGVIDVNTAFKRLNNSDFITSDQINQLAEAKAKVDAGDDAVKKTNQSLDRARISGANAAAGYKMAGDSAASAAVSVEELAKANAKVNSRRTDAQYLLQTSKLLNGNVVLAKQWLEYRNDIGLGSTGRPLTDDEKQRLSEAFKQQQQLKDYEDSLTQSKRKSSEATKQQVKAESDLNQTYEAARRLLYEYGTEYQRIEHDLTQERSAISGAALKGSDKSRMLAEAAAISAARKQVYLLEYEQDVDSWAWTEEKKLTKSLAIEKARIKAIQGMSDAERGIRSGSLEAQHTQAIAWLQLEQNMRLNDASQAFQTDMQNIAAKYEFERQQILLNQSLSDDEQNALVSASYRTQDLDNDSARRQAFGGYQNAIGLDTSFDDALSQRNEAIQAALEWQLITQEEYQDAMKLSEQKYLADRAQLNLSYGEQIFGSMATMLKDSGAEQSAAYKSMFALEKAAAIARSIVAIQAGIAQAAANPFPMNLAAMASVGAATENIVGSIQSVAGVFHGGTDYVPKESSYLLDKGERVLSPRQNTDLTRYLNDRQGNTGGANIQITNNTPTKVDARQDASGRVFVTIDEVEQFVSNSLAQPSSRISKSVSQNTNAGRRR